METRRAPRKAAGESEGPNLCRGDQAELDEAPVSAARGSSGLPGLTIGRTGRSQRGLGGTAGVPAGTRDCVRLTRRGRTRAGTSAARTDSTGPRSAALTTAARTALTTAALRPARQLRPPSHAAGKPGAAPSSPTAPRSAWGAGREPARRTRRTLGLCALGWGGGVLWSHPLSARTDAHSGQRPGAGPRPWPRLRGRPSVPSKTPAPTAAPRWPVVWAPAPAPVSLSTFSSPKSSPPNAAPKPLPDAPLLRLPLLPRFPVFPSRPQEEAALAYSSGCPLPTRPVPRARAPGPLGGAAPARSHCCGLASAGLRACGSASASAAGTLGRRPLPAGGLRPGQTKRPRT